MSGETSFGKYTVVEMIGAGGMAEVFKCKLSGIGGFEKVVVVKRIRTELLQEPEFVRMFLDEARVAAFLSHQNIVQVFEVDQIDGVPYIAMEYVRGPTLAAALRRAKPANLFDYGHAAQVMSGIALGLHHAHTACDSEGQPLHVIHRDVSPSNVLISYDGVPKLLDFGVARARGRQTQTEAGTLKGKLRYMAPEQFQRVEIDHRADVYATGLTLFEACTGEVPYGTLTDPEVIREVVRGASGLPAQFPQGFPQGLEEIIRWATDPDPASRCQNCADLHTALENFLAGGECPSSQRDLAQWVAQLFPNSGNETPGAYGATNTPTSGVSRRTPLSQPNSASGIRRASQSSPGAPIPLDRPISRPNSPSQVRSQSQLHRLAAGEEPAAPPPGKRGLFIGLGLGGLVAAGAVAAFFLTRPEPLPPTPAPQPPVAAPAPPPQTTDDDNVRAYLEKIESLRQAKRYGQALDLMAKARELKPKEASLNIKVSEVADQLEKEALLAKGAKALDNDDPQAALDAAKDVLDRDPEDAQAAKLLAEARQRLAAKAAPATPVKQPREIREGKLSVASTPAGVVYLDDEPLGRAPIRGRALREGKHVVQVRLEGYASFTQTIEVAAGRESSLNAALVAVARKRLASADLGNLGGDKPGTADPAPGRDAPKPPAPENPPAPAPVAAPIPAPAPAPQPAMASPTPTPAQGPEARFPKPKLPAKHTVSSTKELVRSLQAIENAAIAAGASAEAARDSTYALSQELSKRIGPAEPVELFPRAVYYLILQAAASGADRTKIGAQLRTAQLNGTLKESASK